MVLGAALEKAWKCPTTKERHFITPLGTVLKEGLSHRETVAQQIKGHGTQKERERGKGKSKGSTEGLRSGSQTERRSVSDLMRASATIRSASSAHMCNKCVTKRGTTR